MNRRFVMAVNVRAEYHRFFFDLPLRQIMLPSSALSG